MCRCVCRLCYYVRKTTTNVLKLTRQKHPTLLSLGEKKKKIMCTIPCTLHNAHVVELQRRQRCAVPSYTPYTHSFELFFYVKYFQRQTHTETHRESLSQSESISHTHEKLYFYTRKIHVHTLDEFVRHQLVLSANVECVQLQTVYSR